MNQKEDNWKNIIDHVRVGTGKKVHRKGRGSSVTYCGLWTGTHGLWVVKAPSTCEKCGLNDDKMEIIKRGAK